MNDCNLSDIREAITEIRENVAELRSLWPHIVNRVKYLESEVYGAEGKIGLIARLQRVEVIAAWLAGVMSTVFGGIIVWLILGRLQ